MGSRQRGIEIDHQRRGRVGPLAGSAFTSQPHARARTALHAISIALIAWSASPARAAIRQETVGLKAVGLQSDGSARSIVTSTGQSPPNASIMMQSTRRREYHPIVFAVKVLLELPESLSREALIFQIKRHLFMLIHRSDGPQA